MNKQKMLAAQTRLSNMKTNNVLHLILSIITAGFWLPVWVLVAVNNAIERKRLINAITKMENSDVN